jgi:hypothetical protein
VLYTFSRDNTLVHAPAYLKIVIPGSNLTSLAVVIANWCLCNNPNFFRYATLKTSNYTLHLEILMQNAGCIMNRELQLTHVLLAFISIVFIVPPFLI